MDSDLMMVAFGYHGAKFHGSQIQPDVRTVQGELKRAIERLGWWHESCLEMSSRTDSGVSVRMNLATISLPTDIANVIDESSLVSALNDHLPEDLVVWKACRVPVEARFAILNPASHGRIVQDVSLDLVWLQNHSCGIKFVEWLLHSINLQRKILN